LDISFSFCPAEQKLLYSTQMPQTPTTYPSSKDFGWMVFLGVEPKSVGVALAEGLRDGEAGRAPFQLCPGIRLTTQEKHGKPQSGQPQDCSLRRLGALSTHRLDRPAALQSALGQHKRLTNYHSHKLAASANYDNTTHASFLLYSAIYMSEGGDRKMMDEQDDVT
jgi:hypothetical protein